MVREELGVLPHAEDERRAPAGLPRQSEEVDPRHGRDAPEMHGPACLVEGVDLQPAVVDPVAGGPDDRRDAVLAQVELEHGVRDPVGVRADDAGLRLGGQVEAVAGDVGVGLVEHRQVVGVAAGQVVAEVRGERQHAVVERSGHPEQCDALGGHEPEVHGVPAAGAADRDRHVLESRLGRRGVPFLEHAQPPHVVLAAVAAGRPVVGSDRQENPPARAQQLVGDLHSRRACSDHQHRTVGQLPGIAVRHRVQLHHAGVVGHHRRDHRALERPGGGHDAAGVEHPVGRVDAEPEPAGVPADLPHLHAAAHRGLDPPGVGDEVVGDLLLGREAVGVAVEGEAREPVVPGGSVGHQRVPARRAPALRDPAPLEHDVGHAVAAQVLAHRQPGLAAADDDGVGGLYRHGVNLV